MYVNYSLAFFVFLRLIVLVVVLVLDLFAVGKCIHWFPSFLCLFSAQTPANRRRSKTEFEYDWGTGLRDGLWGAM